MPGSVLLNHNSNPADFKGFMDRLAEIPISLKVFWRVEEDSAFLFITNVLQASHGSSRLRFGPGSMALWASLNHWQQESLSERVP